MAHRMPVIDLDRIVELDETDRKIVAGIVNPQTGRLRATKPKHDGRSAYVWRMVAFCVSPERRHHCMPMTTDFYLRQPDGSWDFSAARAEAERLDQVVDQVVNSIPVAEWHGVRRWANALGLIGEPTLTSEGYIVYR